MFADVLDTKEALKDYKNICLFKTQKAVVETLADTLAEVDAVTLADTVGDALALVDTFAEPIEEVEAETLGDTRGDAEALVDTMADKLAEVEAVTFETDWAMRRH